MHIWFAQQTPSIEAAQSLRANTMMEHLGIEITEIGEDYMAAKMPVDHRTSQPYGILHGGASAALAETIGSISGAMCVDLSKKIVVGLEINCNHIRAVRSGYVHGVAKPIHLGGTTHVWDIRITNDDGKLVCVSRLTLAVLDKGK
ncbi:MAG TPA: hotdog fold thioesterase [Thermoflexales bacterium]|nr:hotdog fold thioesterase [Thermoflexales bacterium]HQW35917.1 hotdog fold thioesterase [Thermoflexales bacterium]HQX74748.1 hotdog fold thioesterase [Thermoflexales bacterium]HQZ23088.1 hotdog fold thioesterase [Thermoflexales bacterium]HRA00900.1 hotdog fold thioesterase [Thermoflexales bacterium]